MINSDAYNKMTPLQAAIIIVVIGSGISIIRGPMALVNQAGQWGWITAILSAGFYYAGAYLMVRLMSSFPGQSLVQFLPNLTGKWGTHLFVWFFVLITLFQISFRVQSFGREMTFFLFDRTPIEIIVLTFLLGTAYAGVQDWGTLLRVGQLVFFVVIPFLTIFIAFGMINFQSINLFPLIPENPSIVIKAVPQTWGLFNGYELLLVLYPLIARGTAQLVKWMAISFLIRTLLLLVSTLMTIGVLTAAGTNNTSYPTLLAVRIAELPGTFLERLDNYLLLSWIPIATITVGIYMYCIGKLLAELYSFSDHRPFVIAIIPVLFFGAMALHDIRLAKQAQTVSNWLGLLLTFGSIPFLLFLNWLRIRRTHDTTDQST
jgi:spore germination protein